MQVTPAHLAARAIRFIRVALRFAPSEQPRVYAPCARRSLLRQPRPLPSWATADALANARGDARGDAPDLDSPGPGLSFRGSRGQSIHDTFNDRGSNVRTRPPHRRSRRPAH